MSEQNRQFADGGQHSGIWQELVTSALLGTDRRGAILQPADDALGHLLSGLDGEDAHSKLLGAAAVISLYKRAGRLPEVKPGVLVEPCDIDDTPYCSNRSAQHLAAMLDGQYQELLSEWLQVAASVGKRAPEELLTGLLELGQNDHTFRDPIKGVLGKRGFWLAAQRPDWKTTFVRTTAEDAEAAWETGSRGARLTALTSLRATDPTRARELLNQTLSSEPADVRAAFVKALEQNLSMGDEPFLEKCLDDKSKQVREAAAELLRTLPESRLVTRMEERVMPLVKLWEQKNLLGVRSVKVAVTLPEQLDKSAVRDGVEVSVQTGRGKKAGWLINMVESVPPSVWSRRWGVTPRDALKAFSGSEWRNELLQGWIHAAENFNDVEWAEAILAAATPQDNKVQDLARLIPVLPPERRETWVLDVLRAKKDAMQTRELTWRMLWRLQTPWGPEVSRAILRATRDYLLATANKGDWEMRASLLYFVRAMSPSTLEEAIAVLGNLDTGSLFYVESLQKFAAIAPFRQEMLAELRRE